VFIISFVLVNYYYFLHAVNPLTATFDPPQNTNSIVSIGNDSFSYKDSDKKMLLFSCSNLGGHFAVLYSFSLSFIMIVISKLLDTENRLPEKSTEDLSGHGCLSTFGALQTSHCLTWTSPPALAFSSIALPYLVKNAPKAAAAIGTALALVDAGCCS